MEYKTTLELKEAAKKYEYVKAETLVQAFKDNHVYFPDFIHRFILLKILKKHIFKEELFSTFTDEYKYKLRSYNYFSIYLLENAIKEYNLKVEAHEYKDLFMRFFLMNEKKFKESIALTKTLESLSGEKPIKEESINVCLNEFSSIYYTPKGYLDGLSLSIFKEAVVESYNIQEMKGLAAKYNVILPRRINKSQLISLLEVRLELSQEEKQSIETKPISEICSFAKTKGFKISSDLKKQDMVEFIIFSLEKYHEEVEKDLYNYDIVLDNEDVEEAQVEQQTVESNDQGLPTSSELVDAPEDVTPKEIERNYSEDEIQEDSIVSTVEEEKNEEVSKETENEIKEEIKEVEDEKEEVLDNETTITSNEEVSSDDKIDDNIEEDFNPQVIFKEKDEQPKEIEKTPEVFYDETVDQEIRDIIKKYYSKKNQKDRGFRWIVIGLLAVILFFLIFFMIRFFSEM